MSELPVRAPITSTELRNNITQLEQLGECEWLPTDINSAEWCAQRLRDAQQQLDEIAQTVRAYQEQVAQWADRMLNRGQAAELRQHITFFENRLERFGLEMRRASPVDSKGNPTVKTVPLPSAVINTADRVSKQGHYEVIDHAGFIVWAREHAPELIDEQVNMKALKSSGFGHSPIGIVTDSEGNTVPGIAWHDPVRTTSATVSLNPYTPDED